jgi:phosphate:Na+ symporter
MTHSLAQTAVELNVPEIVIGLFGGMAVFLFGMEQLAAGLKLAAGEGMKTVLARLTTNRFTSLITGMLVTATVQSSTVTTVLLVGFISAGLMTMSQSIGVIMGANIGSTFTAQVIAFRVSNLALLMIAAGFFASYTPKFERVRPYGRALMAVGLVFFGMNVMGDSMAPLRTYPPAVELLAKTDTALVSIVAAAVFAALVHSSAATLGIVIMLAGQGFISLEAGIALAFGANIGTCVTALIAAVGRPREAVRAAVIHVLFNVVGVVIWLGFIGQLADVVRLISPQHAELAGVERLAAETPRQIANAHTVFNVVNALIFIWLTGPFAWLVTKIVPYRPEKEPKVIRPKYLDNALIRTPALAMETVRLEMKRMGGRVEQMLIDAPRAVLRGTEEDLDRVAAMDDEVDRLHGFIITYLGRMSQKELSRTRSRDVLNHMDAVNNLEHIGDTIETNLVALGRQRLQRGVAISEETAEVIGRLAESVLSAVGCAVRAVVDRDREMARLVTGMKEEIGRLVDEAYAHQARRLVAPEPNRLDLYTVEADTIENLKRIYYFAKRMAKTVPGEPPPPKRPGGGDERPPTIAA